MAGAAAVSVLILLGLAASLVDRHPFRDWDHPGLAPVISLLHKEFEMHILPVFSTLITLIFTIAVFNRYRARGGAHLLVWGIGLVFYGLGTAMEVVLGFTFNALALKLWYLSGAMLTAAWLGQGTVNLLWRRHHIAAG